MISSSPACAPSVRRPSHRLGRHAQAYLPAGQAQNLRRPSARSDRLRMRRSRPGSHPTNRGRLPRAPESRPHTGADRPMRLAGPGSYLRTISLPCRAGRRAIQPLRSVKAQGGRGWQRRGFSSCILRNETSYRIRRLVESDLVIFLADFGGDVFAIILDHDDLVVDADGDVRTITVVMIGKADLEVFDVIAFIVPKVDVDIARAGLVGSAELRAQPVVACQTLDQVVGQFGAEFGEVCEALHLRSFYLSRLAHPSALDVTFICTKSALVNRKMHLSNFSHRRMENENVPKGGDGLLCGLDRGVDSHWLPRSLDTISCRACRHRIPSGTEGRVMDRLRAWLGKPATANEVIVAVAWGAVATVIAALILGW